MAMQISQKISLAGNRFTQRWCGNTKEEISGKSFQVITRVVLLRGEPVPGQPHWHSAPCGWGRGCQPGQAIWKWRRCGDLTACQREVSMGDTSKVQTRASTRGAYGSSAFSKPIYFVKSFQPNGQRYVNFSFILSILLYVFFLLIYYMLCNSFYLLVILSTILKAVILFKKVIIK
jgi:hypothetical protein